MGFPGFCFFLHFVFLHGWSISKKNITNLSFLKWYNLKNQWQILLCHTDFYSADHLLLLKSNLLSYNIILRMIMCNTSVKLLSLHLPQKGRRQLYDKVFYIWRRCSNLWSIVISSSFVLWRVWRLLELIPTTIGQTKSTPQTAHEQKNNLHTFTRPKSNMSL